MAESSGLNKAIFELRTRRIKLVKDASANYGRYATLGNVLEVLEPHLLEVGLFIEQFPAEVCGTPGLATIITHAETGESRGYTAPLILDKQTPQGVGSAITYMRRYALVSAFALDADEDDDGAAAEPPTPSVHKPKAKAKKDESPAPDSESKPRVF